MNYSDYRFTLDITNTLQAQVSVPATFGDSARRLYIGLNEGRKPYTIVDGCRAVFVALKPDESSIFNDCIIENNKTIVYEFSTATTSAEGIVNCEIRLYGVDGKLITSPQFIIVVDKRVLRDSEIPISESEHTTLDNIILAEQARIKAENVRVLAEELRNTVEEGRVIAEAERNSKEAERNASESNRIWAENERVIAERARQEAEAKRENNSNQRIDKLEEQVAELMYKPITITSFTNDVNTARFGQVVNTVKLSWAFSKEPVSAALYDKNGNIIYTVPPTSARTELSGSYSENVSWTLKATDEKGTVASKSTNITFYHGVYYGVGDARDSYDSAFINSLSVEWRTNKKPSFTPSPNNQHVYYCLPVSMGECSFSVGVLPGGFELAGTISHTNAYGGTENYYIYRSVEALSGTITVNVA